MTRVAIIDDLKEILAGEVFMTDDGNIAVRRPRLSPSPTYFFNRHF